MMLSNKEDRAYYGTMYNDEIMILYLLFGIYFILKDREEEILRLTKLKDLLLKNGDANGALEFIKKSEESKIKQDNLALKERNRYLESMFESVGLMASKIERITETVKEK